MPAINAPPKNVTLNIKSGDTVRVRGHFSAAGVDQDMTGWSAIGQVRAAKDPNAVKFADFTITVDSPASGGWWTALLAPATSKACVDAAVAAGVVVGHYEIQWTTNTGDKKTAAAGQAVFDQSGLGA